MKTKMKRFQTCAGAKPLFLSYPLSRWGSLQLILREALRQPPFAASERPTALGASGLLCVSSWIHFLVHIWLCLTKCFPDSVAASIASLRPHFVRLWWNSLVPLLCDDCTDLKKSSYAHTHMAQKQVHTHSGHQCPESGLHFQKLGFFCASNVF